MADFSELVGQGEAVELLKQALLLHRVAPAYLFAGPPGVGRTIAAEAFSQLLLAPQGVLEGRTLANHPDFLWVEPTYAHQGNYLTAAQAAQVGLKRKAPPQIRIEQVRDIARFLSRPSLEAARSVVVVEDAQTMTEAAANALLKTLEEPGAATLILIAPSTDALLPTLVSRCQQIPFRRLSQECLKQVLQAECSEALQQPFVLEMAQGSPGEAIAAFFQLQTVPQELLQGLHSPPKNALAALTLAKTVEKLDTQSQLWLLDYLQYSYWHLWRQKTLIDQLEHAHHCLLNFVQPRLVWEVTLLKLSQTV